MNLSAIFIRRPVMTILVMLFLIFFGIFSYMTLPVSDLPDVAFPTIEVNITYPGADPEMIANTVVVPLEQQFASVQDIQSISSNSRNGSATIVLQFALSRSLDVAGSDVLAAINAAEPELPPDLPFSPTYFKFNPTSTPILFLAMTSKLLSAADLYNYAYTIVAQRLSMVDGVANVQTFGSPFAVRVQADPQKLSARNIGFDELAETIKNANVYLPTGTFYGPKTEFSIACQGQMFHGSEYEEVIVKTNEDGSITRIRDIGRAIDSVQNDKWYFHYFRKDINLPTVGLAIQKQPNANALSTIEKINALLPSLMREVPSSLNLWRVYDQSDYIHESVNDVELTLAIALALVVAVIFVYLGKGIDTLIPSLAIPISVLGTLIAMKLLGYTIDILSLLAMTLAIGFLVDDAIVVLENIVRHVEGGNKKPFDAALEGSKEISTTILSMTISLASIFIPLIFMEGIIGRVLHEFAMVIMIAILISGAISLTFTPMLCSRLIPEKKEGVKKTWMERFSEKFNERLLHIYKPALNWCLTNGKTTLLIALISLGATISIALLLPKDFLPDDDIGFIEGFIQGPDSNSPFATASLLEKISPIVCKNPHVEQMVSIGGLMQDNEGNFYIRLKPINQRPPTNEVIRMLMKDLGSVPDAQIFMKPLPLINLQVGAAAAKGNYQYTLQSFDSEELYRSSGQILQKMHAIEGLSQISSDLNDRQPQLKLTIERDKASIYGITVNQIENVLSYAYGATYLSPINEPNNLFYVILETLPEFYRDPSKLDQIWLRSNNGGLVPLSEIVTKQETTGPVTVNHLNGLPSVTITFNVEGIPLETALDQINRVAESTLPPATFGAVQGAANIFKQSFANLNALLMITIFVIYIILGILYENFLHPFTVLSTLPPAALGGLLSLLITGNSLSLYAFVGIILLLGIVMKNGIILIDFANNAIQVEKKTVDEAILEACHKRFRPILMTTFAALMGAVPIAIGIGGTTAQGRRPLGIVIVGGLLFSQVLTLLLTPVIYVYLEKLRERLHRKRS